MKMTMWMVVLALVVALGSSSWAMDTAETSFQTRAAVQPVVVDPELTIDEMLAVVASGSALILDSRSYPEWAVGHIPGALVLAPKPGQTASQYVSDIAEVARLTAGDQDTAIVLYCNGPRCGKSKRLNAELQELGYTNVRRFQLGAPVWRALANPMVIEAAGIRYVLGDATAYWVDARDPSAFAPVSWIGVTNLTNVTSGQVELAKDERRLPMHDYNTRIVVFGSDGDQARELALELTRGAFHNVAYFDGGIEAFTAATFDVSVASARDAEIVSPFCALVPGGVIRC
jgi:rhodanese-related sulfurtransferase